jgi:hypothetical protein
VLTLANNQNQDPTMGSALATILSDDPMRRKFRRYLKTLGMEENVRFWDAVMLFKAEKTEFKRYVQARAIVQTFVTDASQFQVNLKGETKTGFLDAMAKNDRVNMQNLDFFDAATNELFEDLRKSEAFRGYLDNDTFSVANLSEGLEE